MDEKKILLAGLDNAGKTSILMALEKKHSFTQILREIAPTIRIEYSQAEILGVPVNVWDMGGQASYREVYSRRLDYYFADADALIYVVDAQDRARFDEAVAYLSDVLRYFFDEGLDVPTYVFFHKVDPKIRDSNETKARLTEYRRTIERKLFFWRQHVHVTESSIFDVQSLAVAWSEVLSRVVPALGPVSSTIAKWGVKLPRIGSILFQADGVVLAEDYPRDLSPEVLDEVFTKAREAMVLVEKMHLAGAFADVVADTSSERGVEFQLHRLEVGGASYYLALLLRGEEAAAADDNVSLFVEELKEELARARRGA
ncbi:MAG: hypothetical protein Kow0069_28970 [Promethearchaeota archaeon]